jgi:hypothetical protein
VASAPSLVISVRQDTVAGERWARSSAEREAMQSAFWETAARELARIAPKATVARK